MTLRLTVVDVVAGEVVAIMLPDSEDERPPAEDKDDGGIGVTVQFPGPGIHPNLALCPAT
mgnify:CR=1 FL=1